MKMKFIVFFLVTFSLSAFADKNMLGERTTANSSELCTDTGCGECNKLCPYRVNTEGAVDKKGEVKPISTTTNRSSKKSTVVGE